MTDAKPQHDLDAQRASPLQQWLAYIAWKAQASEAARRARLEASPVRLALLKRAAEKRARRRARNLANAAVAL